MDFSFLTMGAIVRKEGGNVTYRNVRSVSKTILLFIFKVLFGVGSAGHV